MSTKTYGYARVSTKEQNEDRQLIALLEFPIRAKNIFIDKVSGKDFDRPQYKALMKKLREKDVVVVKSIDRLGRNYEEIQEQWRIITKIKKAYIVVLDMPLLDTRSTNKNLMGVFVADLVLQILSYVAQAERENIRQRQAEGIAAAKMRGVRFGRPKLCVPERFCEIRDLYFLHKLTSRQAAKELHVAQDTFLRWIKEDRSSAKTLHRQHKKVY